MPILASSKRSLRSSKVKTARNMKLRAKIEKATKKTLKLIELGEAKLAQNQLANAYQMLDKGAKRNIIRAEKASRIKSRLTQKVNQIKKDVKTAPKGA